MAGGGEGEFSFYPGIHYYRLWDTVPKINLNLRLKTVPATPADQMQRYMSGFCFHTAEYLAQKPGICSNCDKLR